MERGRTHPYEYRAEMGVACTSTGATTTTTTSSPLGVGVACCGGSPASTPLPQVGVASGSSSSASPSPIPASSPTSSVSFVSSPQSYGFLSHQQDSPTNMRHSPHSSPLLMQLQQQREQRGVYGTPPLPAHIQPIPPSYSLSHLMQTQQVSDFLAPHVPLGATHSETVRNINTNHTAPGDLADLVSTISSQSSALAPPTELDDFFNELIIPPTNERYSSPSSSSSSPTPPFADRTLRSSQYASYDASSTTTTTNVAPTAKRRRTKPQALMKPKREKVEENSDLQRKKKKTNQACAFCRRSHSCCDNFRPCSKCVARGIGALCVKNGDSCDGVVKKFNYLTGQSNPSSAVVVATSTGSSNMQRSFSDGALASSQSDYSSPSGTSSSLATIPSRELRPPVALNANGFPLAILEAVDPSKRPLPKDLRLAFQKMARRQGWSHELVGLWLKVQAAWQRRDRAIDRKQWNSHSRSLGGYRRWMIKGAMEAMKSFDHLSDPIIIWTEGLRIFGANKAACAFFGRSHDELCNVYAGYDDDAEDFSDAPWSIEQDVSECENINRIFDVVHDEDAVLFACTAALDAAACLCPPESFDTNPQALPDGTNAASANLIPNFGFLGMNDPKATQPTSSNNGSSSNDPSPAPLFQVSRGFRMKVRVKSSNRQQAIRKDPFAVPTIRNPSLPEATPQQRSDDGVVCIVTQSQFIDQNSGRFIFATCSFVRVDDVN